MQRSQKFYNSQTFQNLWRPKFGIPEFHQFRKNQEREKHQNQKTLKIPKSLRWSVGIFGTAKSQNLAPQVQEILGIFGTFETFGISGFIEIVEHVDISCERFVFVGGMSIHTYMHARMHACMPACVRTCIYIYTHIHTQMHMYVCIYIYICVCVCVHVCMYMCMHACMCIYIYYIYIYIYIYMCIYIYTYVHIYECMYMYIRIHAYACMKHEHIAQERTCTEMLEGTFRHRMVLNDDENVQGARTTDRNRSSNIVDRVTCLNIQGDRLTRQGLDKDLHAASQAQHQVKGRFLLDVVIRKGTAVFQLLASEDQALLVGRDAFLVLDLSLDIVDRVTCLNVQGDRLTRQSLDKDLHAASQAQHQVKGRFLLDVVIRKGTAVFQLLASEDQALLVGRDAFLVLDLSLDIVDRVTCLNIQSDRLTRQGLDKDLHAASQAQHQVKGRFLLDVVIRKGTAVFQLLASEDQALLVGRDAFLVLDLSLDIVDRVTCLNVQGDRLTRQGLDKDLHAASQAQHQVKGRFLLDVVIRKGTAVFQLLASEDQALLVGRDAFLVLDLSLDIVDRVTCLNIQSNRLARQGLDKDLHRCCKCRIEENVWGTQGTRSPVHAWAGVHEPLRNP